MMKAITNTQTVERSRASDTKRTGRLFFLEASGGRIHSADADGSNRKVIVTGCRIPDGIVVDVDAGHIYWTNMGVPSRNDGSIERADLDGQNRVPLSMRARHLHQSSYILKRRAANFIGAIAKECASCARISMDQKSKRWLTRARARRGQAPI
jgi:hypothetical protein